MFSLFELFWGCFFFFVKSCDSALLKSCGFTISHFKRFAAVNFAGTLFSLRATLLPPVTSSGTHAPVGRVQATPPHARTRCGLTVAASAISTF